MGVWMLGKFETLNVGFGWRFVKTLPNQRVLVQGSVLFLVPVYRNCQMQVTIWQNQQGSVRQGICRCCRNSRGIAF
jgi:hypothetical protein